MLPKGTSVTLVEPRYPVNVGHVARLLKNFGVERFYLVRPDFDMTVAAVYAAHASDVLDSAQVATFDEVRKENDLLVATTAVRASRSNVARRTVSPERLHSLLSASRSSSLVFGRETTGLTVEEIRACDLTSTINMGTSYRALNIGHAAAIFLYLVSRGRSPGKPTQSRVAREVFVRSFNDLAKVSGVHSQKLKSLSEAEKRIVSASSLSDRQLNLMAGVFNKATAKVKGTQGLD